MFIDVNRRIGQMPGVWLAPNRLQPEEISSILLDGNRYYLAVGDTVRRHFIPYQEVESTLRTEVQESLFNQCIRERLTRASVPLMNQPTLHLTTA